MLKIKLLLLIALMFIAVNVFSRDNTGDSFAVFSNRVDSLYDALDHPDSAAAMAVYESEKVKYQNDKQAVYQLEIAKYWWMQNHGNRNETFEKDLLGLCDELKKNGYERAEAEALRVLADYYWHNVKDLSRTLENAIYVYDIAAQYSIEEFPHKGEAIYMMSVLYYIFRDFDTMKYYLLEYFRVMPASHTKDKANRLNTLGLCYQSLEQYDSASWYFRKAIEIAKQQKDTEWEELATGNLAYIYFLQKKYDESLALFERDTMAKKIDNIDDADALSIVGELYYFKNNRKRALEYTNRAYDILMARGGDIDYYDVKMIYPVIARVFAGTGNYQLAYALLDTVTTADDSVFKSRNAVLMAGVQHKTEAQKHMAEIEKKELEVTLQKKLRNSFIAGFSVVLCLSGLVLYQKRRISREKARSEELLLNILPQETAEELKKKGSADAKYFDEVTVLFTDFKHFTQMSEKLSAQELVKEINHCYSAFDNIITRHGIEKIKTIGDSYMCAGGLPVENKSHAEDVVRAALEIRDFINAEKQKRTEKGLPFFEIRIGCHTGPVVAGIVGIKKFAYDIWGDTVNTAARMESSGEQGKVNISGATFNFVKEKFACEYRGKILAKNKGEIDMYFVEN